MLFFTAGISVFCTFCVSMFTMLSGINYCMTTTIASEASLLRESTVTFSLSLYIYIYISHTFYYGINMQRNRLIEGQRAR